MFYVKEKLNDALEVSIELNDENVFCKCPYCGTEMQVDLAEVFDGEPVDLFGTAILWHTCSKKVLRGEV